MDMALNLYGILLLDSWAVGSLHLWPFKLTCFLSILGGVWEDGYFKGRFRADGQLQVMFRAVGEYRFVFCKVSSKLQAMDQGRKGYNNIS